MFKGKYMKCKDCYIDIVQQLGVIFYGIATGEEDDDFLPSVFLEEGVEEEEALVGLANNVSL
jgi:hypothetical protein